MWEFHLYFNAFKNIMGCVSCVLIKIEQLSNFVRVLSGSTNQSHEQNYNGE